MRTCTVCSSSITEGTAVCPICGTDLQAAPPRTSATPPRGPTGPGGVRYASPLPGTQEAAPVNPSAAGIPYATSYPGPALTQAPDLPGGMGPADEAATAHSARLDRMTGSIVVGKYYILELLGEGGMGQVYKARHLSLDRLVCVKILRAQLNDNPTIVSRFEREAKSASRLNHPNSIQIIDFGRLDRGSGFYIVMEFVEGRDLATLLADEWPLPESRTAHIIGQVLSALSAAHAAQVIHRDLKPENIMVGRIGDDPDFVKVLDFGIAKIMAPEVPGLTRADLVCGTPQYMSPEQATGASFDSRSDLYSVGVILYRMATGFLPFEGRNPMEYLAKHATEKPTPPRVRRPDAPISPAMEALILRALDKDPTRRPQTADEFRRELLSIGRASAANERPMPNALPPGMSMGSALTLGMTAEPVPTYGYQEAPSTAAPPGNNFGPGFSTMGTAHTASPFKRDVQADYRAQRRSARLRRLVKLAILGALVGGGYFAYPYVEPNIPPAWKAKPAQWYAWGEDQALQLWNSATSDSKPPPAPTRPPPAPTPEPPPVVAQTPPPPSPRPSSRGTRSNGEPRVRNAMAQGADRTNDSDAKPLTDANGECPKNMVLVAAMGDASFASFCIDQYEYPNTPGNFPLVLKTWDDARTDCNRMHKRLCTSDEWEHACRGPRNREWAGTNVYTTSDSEWCNGADDHGKRGRIAQSGSRKKCLSGYAVYDLSGNAGEWTSTPAPNDPEQRLIMGGSVEGGAAELKCSARSIQPRTMMSDVIGFRCCADPL